MYLFFDTETTGLPKNWRASVEEVDNWPRMVEICWWLTPGVDGPGARGESVVMPEGFVIPEAAADVHGITSEDALTRGEFIETVLRRFYAAVNVADVLVAHNVAFDLAIVGAELCRLGKTKQWGRVSEKQARCTKEESTEWMKLPGTGTGYKWPTLGELHNRLFGCDIEGAHRAAADVDALAACFFELLKLGVIAG